MARPLHYTFAATVLLGTREWNRWVKKRGQEAAETVRKMNDKDLPFLERLEVLRTLGKAGARVTILKKLPALPYENGRVLIGSTSIPMTRRRYSVINAIFLSDRGLTGPELEKQLGIQQIPPEIARINTVARPYLIPRRDLIEKHDHRPMRYVLTQDL